jgi:hypothetical protein
MTKICSAIARQQAASQRVEKPQPAAAPFSIFPVTPKTWEHQNEKARIETDRAGRGARKVIWTR